ncbi:MAG TPA: fumarylacetoacetate hydrolase family protein [Stellaceae bacterium]|nr:fumarylacetoacetate hydrolase family protein [Stellaceae bacterium]
MNDRELAAAVAEFEAARTRGEYFPKAWYDRLSLDDSYRLQLALIRRRGTRRVGWKVGLTSTAIQQQFQVHEPVFGCLLADGRLESGHAFRRGELIEPGFENELCIVMGRDLMPGATREEIAAAVARVHPAFEIIETRGDLTRQLALALADNAQQKAFVLGPPIERRAVPELDRVVVSVGINGVPVATADGGAVLGHPYNSVAWLAGKLVQFGEAVRAGDYIMSGSFTRQFPLNPGDRIEAAFAGIGTVTASVA